MSAKTRASVLKTFYSLSLATTCRNISLSAGVDTSKRLMLIPCSRIWPSTFCGEVLPSSTIFGVQAEPGAGAVLPLPGEHQVGPAFAGQGPPSASRAVEVAGEGWVEQELDLPVGASPGPRGACACPGKLLQLGVTRVGPFPVLERRLQVSLYGQETPQLVEVKGWPDGCPGASIVQLKPG